MPLAVLFQMHRDNVKPTKKTIGITFDDGYENNYTRVLPLLKAHRFPATKFIITQCIEDEFRLTWYDYIDFIRRHLTIEKLDTRVINRPSPGNISELRNLIKSLNIHERSLLFTEIQKQVRVEDYLTEIPREHWKLLNKAQIKDLSDSGLVEIGSHTHNHPNLGLLSDKDVRSEIQQSKALLEALLNKEVPTIAFPDGSYDQGVKKICLEVGYRNLLAVDYKCGEDNHDQSTLARCGISSTTTFESNMIRVSRGFNLSGF